MPRDLIDWRDVYAEARQQAGGQLPTVNDMARVSGRSYGTAYQAARKKGFPVRKDGRCARRRGVDWPDVYMKACLKLNDVPTMRELANFAGVSVAATFNAREKYGFILKRGLAPHDRLRQISETNGASPAKVVPVVSESAHATVSKTSVSSDQKLLESEAHSHAGDRTQTPEGRTQNA